MFIQISAFLFWHVLLGKEKMGMNRRKRWETGYNKWNLYSSSTLFTSGCHCSTVSCAVTICLKVQLLLEKYSLKKTVKGILPLSLHNQGTSFWYMDISYALFSYAFNMLNKETVNASHLFSWVRVIWWLIWSFSCLFS